MQLEQRVEAVLYLVDVVQELSVVRSLDQITEIVKTAARKIANADGATFVLRDNGKCYYVDEDAIGPLWKGQRFPMSACVSGWVMNNSVPCVIGDIYEDERVPVSAYAPTFVKSLTMVPIREVEPIGAIGVYWADKHQASAEEVSLIQTLANTTAVAMENVQVYTELEDRVRQRTAEVERLSLSDDLTGLNNRRGFLLLAGQELSLARRMGAASYLLFIDLDGLKAINDSMGHEAGDNAIQDAANIIRQTFRKSDIVGRLGGDEFVVFIISEEGESERIKQRLQLNIDYFSQEQLRPYKVAMSIGIEETPCDETPLELLIKKADEQMYAQKQLKKQQRGLGGETSFTETVRTEYSNHSFFIIIDSPFQSFFLHSLEGYL